MFEFVWKMVIGMESYLLLSAFLDAISVLLGRGAPSREKDIRKLRLTSWEKGLWSISLRGRKP
jgi:hypothetical protein